MNIPEFGERQHGQKYVPRPGAYALIFDARGCLAVMETPRGCFLPGGGREGSETPEEAVAREVQEECGFEISVGVRIGEAVEYVYTAGSEAGIRKECVFFQGVVVAGVGAATEADHVLVWLDPKEARRRLRHESQRWAVMQTSDEDRTT